MKNYDVVADGIIGISETEYKRTKLNVSRSISDGGDTILIIPSNQQDGSISYMVPTVYLVELLKKQ